MSKILPLPNGSFAIVDDDDFEKCAPFRWRTNDKGYVVRTAKNDDGSESTQRLSRFVMNAPDGLEIDHINGNKLDNRKSELRLCTHQQNVWNRGKFRNNTSGYKGVHWDRQRSEWMAQLKVNGKSIYLGRFTGVLEAAAAYAAASIKYHGEFART